MANVRYLTPDGEEGYLSEENLDLLSPSCYVYLVDTVLTQRQVKNREELIERSRERNRKTVQMMREVHFTLFRRRK